MNVDTLSPFYRALCFLAYGGAGTRKTVAVHTLPPPILHIDKEGGSSSLIPWMRTLNGRTLSQEAREKAFTMLSQENQKWCKTVANVAPSPYIDSVYFDVLDPDSWQRALEYITSLPPNSYNSIAIDSLQELSQEAQTHQKNLMGRKALDVMHVQLWAGAQERVAILLRYLKNLRDKGVFIYLICSEQIDKDYVTDPRATPHGASPETPYSVSGCPAVPGKLVTVVQHSCDIMVHSRILNGKPVFVSQPEPLPGGSAFWYAKDRTGRLRSTYYPPSFRAILSDIFDEETFKGVYSGQV